MFAREYRSVTQHFSQNTADAPYIYRLSVALRVEHDLGGSVPPCSHILCQESSVVMIRIGYTCQTEITYLQNQLTITTLYGSTDVTQTISDKCHWKDYQKCHPNSHEFGLVNGLFFMSVTIHSICCQMYQFISCVFQERRDIRCKAQLLHHVICSLKQRESQNQSLTKKKLAKAFVALIGNALTRLLREGMTNPKLQVRNLLYICHERLWWCNKEKP